MINKKYLNNKKNSIKYFYKITKSMEMVSISKLKFLEIKLINNNLYNNFFLKLVNNLNFIKNNQFYLRNNIFFNKILYLIIFTDQGLCGNLNINLFKKVINHIKIKKYFKNKIYFFLIGKKINFINEFINLDWNIKIINYKFLIKKIFNDNKYLHNLVNKIIDFYSINIRSKIYIVFNFLNKNKILNKIDKLLPINMLNKNIYYRNYIYEDCINIINNKVFFKYIDSKIYNSILKNYISENFSRILIMKNASKNSKNLYNKLNIMYNKLRQFNITKEILELISTLNTL